MNKDQLIKETSDLFQKQYFSKADVISVAPGRVNIIGEHTDYNGGLALPVAIDMYVCIALRENKNKVINAYSVNLNEYFSSDINEKIQELVITANQGQIERRTKVREELFDFRDISVYEPYVKEILPEKFYLSLPETEHIHFYGFYLGNYPSLNEEEILRMTSFSEIFELLKSKNLEN